ncbi:MULTISPECIES: ParB/RepB/Spo0J family partition protein [unclassified Nocardia]|uniref:ParB/RepB/Spo0J family partition protein n=1 Tax=unclassified Nocardia TaxID=2637762 RepID=UPI001CE43DEB|nr:MULTISPECIES: ParB/RepB/Spo0J family partition protein [unclassified Nocardia]
MSQAKGQAKKGGLGRGLAALIPPGPGTGGPGLSASAARELGIEPVGPQPPSYLHRVPDLADETAELAAGGAVYREIPADQIEPNPKQPRQYFEDEALDELVHSIREFGLMQPIVVRRIDGDAEKYQLVMGERRWRASKLAGLTAIPAIVRETADDSMLRDALLENIHRVQLNPLEEGAAYQQLLEEFDVTHEELAKRIGRSRSVVTNMIRLLNLPIAVQGRVATGILSAGHARALLGLNAGPAAQEELAKRIVAEGLSVRTTEEAVRLANLEPEPEPRDEDPTPRRKPIEMPGLQKVADRLSHSFDTRVIVSMGKRKGKIVVEFGSVEDLERIVSLMEQQQLGS